MLDLQTEKTESTDPNLRPEVMSVLGLNEETVKKAAEIRNQEIRLQAGLGTWGKDTYKLLKSRYSGNGVFPPQPGINLITDEVLQKAQVDVSYVKIPVKTIDLPNPISSPSQMPDQFMAGWKNEKAKNVLSEEDIKTYNQRINRFLTEFASGAMEAADWETVVNTYDVMSPEGILKNTQAISLLRHNSTQNPNVGIAIAEAMSRRLEKREAEAAAGRFNLAGQRPEQSPPPLTPQPVLRPVPPPQATAPLASEILNPQENLRPAPANPNPPAPEVKPPTF